MKEREKTMSRSSAVIYKELIAAAIYTMISVGVVSSTGVLTFGELLAPRLVTIALGNGFAYSTGVYLTVISSGAGIGYLNPAITLALTIAGHASKDSKFFFHVSKMLLMTTAQVVGTALGIVLVLVTVPDADKTNETLGVPGLSNGMGGGGAFAIEALGAFFLTWIVLISENHSIVGSRIATAPLSVGMAMTSLVLFAFPFTTASFNPARALCLFLFSGTFNEDMITFILGPYVGSIVATGLYMLAFSGQKINRESENGGVVSKVA